MNQLPEIDGFDASTFLTDYWNRQPCLIRGWLRPEAIEVATMLSLAAANELPTRLVEGAREAEDWRVTHGLVDINELPDRERDWTLLVQELDKVDADVAAVLDEFRFLPHWILDDIMVSQAAPGGSVGPHKDAYDVFLVQVAGRRRWELSTRTDFEPDQRFELALIGDWSAELAIDVEPGDVLYLPPGVGHHGVARTDCQTWSVGLRTPSGPELMFQLADTLLDDPGFNERLQARTIDPQQPDIIQPELIAQARRLLEQSLKLDDRALGRMLATFLTRWRLWPGDELVDLSMITRQLRAGHPVHLATTARLALFDDQLFVNGEQIDCNPSLALELSRKRCLSSAWLGLDEALEQLLELGAIARPLGPAVVR